MSQIGVRSTGSRRAARMNKLSCQRGCGMGFQI
jgi:hypothetical protein